MNKVLLFGPRVDGDTPGAYGGGTGGYTRKMALYLNNFKSNQYEHIPCYHTIRGEGIAFGFIGRIFTDFFRLFKCISQNDPMIIHFLGQYRTALPREFMGALLSKIRSVPYVYEIKAGVFVKWYKSTHRINRWMMNYTLRNASGILGQGMPYIHFVQQQLNLPITYYPNFVASSELEAVKERTLFQTIPKILFVGYAYEGKGVFELVEACEKVALKHPLELTLVGKEHEDFTAWLAKKSFSENFTLNRLGKQSHDKVLEIFQTHDIYCYPTRHGGEGHNNTINEALMSNMIIVTTKQGFLESIIGQDRGYLLEEVSVEAIVNTLEHIIEYKEEAIERADNGKKYLKEHFIDTAAFRKLESMYGSIHR